MYRTLSPMSTTNANATVPDTVERKTNGLRSLQLSPTKTLYHRDIENVPSNQPYEPPSSPFQGENTLNMDDTHFSAFSAVPNQDMTQFAQPGQLPQRRSPTKSRPQTPHSGDMIQSTVFQTPRSSGRNGSREEHSPSPTPRRPRSRHEGDTTNLLVDFTEQFNGFAKPHQISPTRRHAPMKSSRTQPDLVSYAADLRTPSPKKQNRNNLINFLEYELPEPTPRSQKTITPRELETMKSEFQSQITSLKATLSGKEAEVASLKNAASDAERRVGEALEELSEGRHRIEDLEAQKLDWEKRDKEMQDVCRGVKQEILRSEQDREELEKNLHEAESRAIEAESKLSVGSNSDKNATVSNPELSTPHAPATAGSSEVDAAVERVARELHTLYKGKHETKVKALKKSYEARWEKKISTLSTQVQDLTKENEELKLGRDATMSGVVPAILTYGSHQLQPASPAKRTSTFTEDFAKASEMLQEEHAAALATLSSQLENSKAEAVSLSSQLEASHQEMAELVAATEEMISLQVDQSVLLQQQQQQQQHPPHPPAYSQPSTSSSDDPAAVVPRSARRQSINPPVSRSHSSSGNGTGSSGMTPRTRPLSGVSSNNGPLGESRIGRGGFGASGASRSFGRSGIVNNIERMGRGRAQD